MNCIELSGTLNNKMCSPLSSNSTNYRLLLNLQPIFPGEICFTRLQLCTWARPHSAGWQSSLLCGQQRWCLVWMQAPAGERWMTSGADLLHPTAKGKPEHLGINSLDQDAHESFREGKFPVLRHLALGAVTISGPVPRHCRPRGPCAHTTSRLLAACAGGENTTQGLTGVTDTVGRCIWYAELSFFLEARGLLSFCCVLQSDRGQGHWGILLFIYIYLQGVY